MPKKPCTGMPFILATKVTVDLSHAESFSIWYERPDGSTGTVTATESSTRRGYITALIPSSVNDADQAGQWRARLLVKWDYDDNPAKGIIAKFIVEGDE